MKRFIKFLIDSFDYEKNYKLANTRPPVIAKDKEHLFKLIKKELHLYGNKCSLNHIDVSQIGDMSNLFRHSEFNGDISKWNTVNVSNMKYMFAESKFNGDISNWNVSNVQDMMSMFSESIFNRDISKWNVENLKSMSYMFKESLFNKDISDWKPYKEKGFFETFEDAKMKIPYWAGYDDLDDRKRAIDRYHWEKELSQDLSVKNSSKKRVKI